MYGCCSTECATIIHLKKSKSHTIKNEIRFSKKENQAAFKKMQILWQLFRQLSWQNANLLQKKAVKIKKYLGKGAHFFRNQMLDSF
jgi:UPF0176 protein